MMLLLISLWFERVVEPATFTGSCSLVMAKRQRGSKRQGTGVHRDLEARRCVASTCWSDCAWHDSQEICGEKRRGHSSDYTHEYWDWKVEVCNSGRYWDWKTESWKWCDDDWCDGWAWKWCADGWSDCAWRDSQESCGENRRGHSSDYTYEYWDWKVQSWQCGRYWDWKTESWKWSDDDWCDGLRDDFQEYCHECHEKRRGWSSERTDEYSSSDEPRKEQRLEKRETVSSLPSLSMSTVTVLKRRKEPKLKVNHAVFGQEMEKRVDGNLEPNEEPPPGCTQDLREQRFEVAGQELSGKMCLQRLAEFVANFPLDSFTAGSVCSEFAVRNSAESGFFDEKKGVKGKVKITFRLPAACHPIHLVLEEEIEASKSELEKHRVRERLAAGALEKLYVQGCWPVAEPIVSSVEPAVEGSAYETQNGLGGTPGLVSLSVHQWPDGKVQIYHIDADDGSMWGLATISPANFSYQWKIGGKVLRLKAMTASWNSAHAKHAFQFQRPFISRDPEDIAEVIVVKLQGIQDDNASIDFDAMRDSETKVPVWFPNLIRKMERISYWERVRGVAPIEPAPSPMKLRVICDDISFMDSEEDAREHCEARESLAKAGADALRLAAVLAILEDEPEVARSVLEERVEECLQPALLASLLVKSKFPQLGTRRGISQGDAAQMFLAIFGAQKVESDMFAVVKLWQWFAEGRTGRTGDKMLLKALEHVAVLPNYCGRTPSIMEFGEIMVPEEERDAGPQLMVRYEEYDDAIYRWNKSKAEERRPDINSGWQPCIWDAVQGIFLSPSILTADGVHRPLPRKVCGWLRGCSITQLVNVKQNPVVSPLRYTILKEDGDRLLVVYEQHGNIWYRRSPYKGLGIEIAKMGCEEEERHVSFSESSHALYSQFVAGSALPRKVVSWLTEMCCLADLVPASHGKKCVAGVDTTKMGIASWEFDGKTYSVRVRQKNPQYGKIYELVTGEALSYSHVKKSFVVFVAMSDCGICQEVVVPPGAIYHIAGPGKQESGLGCSSWITGTIIGQVEAGVHYRFKGVDRLAEALTHGSATEARTPSCERLALVGEIALKAYLSERVWRSQENSYLIAALIVADGVLPLARSFSSPAGWPGWASTKQRQEGVISSNLQIGVDSIQCLERLEAAICNHVSCAKSCVKTSLHRFINESSSHLRHAVQKFEKRALREDINWIRLFTIGAPKVLGDVFLACAGAIIVESDHKSAELLFAEHYKDCVGVCSLLPVMPNFDIVSFEDMRVTFDVFTEAAARSGIGKRRQLAPWVPSSSDVEPEGDQGDAKRAFRLAIDARCSDVFLLDVQEERGGRALVCGSSPRAAIIRYGLTQLRAGNGLSDDSDGSDGDSELEEWSIVGESGSVKDAMICEIDGAFWCGYCDKWLNGPQQWADHESGKDHIKIVRNHDRLKAAQEPTKKMPDGFGKRKQASREFRVTPEDYQAHCTESCEDSVVISGAGKEGTEDQEPDPEVGEGVHAALPSHWPCRPLHGYYLNQATGELVRGIMHVTTPHVHDPWQGHPNYSEARLCLAIQFECVWLYLLIFQA